MSKSEGKSDKTFLQTVPGILTSLAALITAIGGCIAVVFGIPAISNAVFGSTPNPIISQTTASPSADIPTLTQVPTNVPQSTSPTVDTPTFAQASINLSQTTSSPSADIPTFTQAPINAPQPTNNLNGPLSVRLPTLEEIYSEAPPSIWDINSIQIQDMPAPGVQVYLGNVQKNSEYLFPMYWCAKSLNILDDNLQFISIQFLVNNEPIASEYIQGYVKGTDAGWQCKYFSVILGGWDENIQYTLEVRRVVSKSISDGETLYVAGTYTRKIIVDVHL